MSLIRPRHREEEEEEEVEKVVQELGREGEYRVGLVVLNMPWVDMDFNVPPPNGPANSAKFHLPWQNRADSGMTKQSQLNPTSDHKPHPVLSFGALAAPADMTWEVGTWVRCPPASARGRARSPVSDWHKCSSG